MLEKVEQPVKMAHLEELTLRVDSVPPRLEELNINMKNIMETMDEVKNKLKLLEKEMAMVMKKTTSQEGRKQDMKHYMGANHFHRRKRSRGDTPYASSLSSEMDVTADTACYFCGVGGTPWRVHVRH